MQRCSSTAAGVKEVSALWYVANMPAAVREQNNRTAVQRCRSAAAEVNKNSIVADVTNMPAARWNAAE